MKKIQGLIFMLFVTISSGVPSQAQSAALLGFGFNHTKIESLAGEVRWQGQTAQSYCFPSNGQPVLAAIFLGKNYSSTPHQFGVSLISHDATTWQEKNRAAAIVKPSKNKKEQCFTIYVDKRRFYFAQKAIRGRTAREDMLNLGIAILPIHGYYETSQTTPQQIKLGGLSQQRVTVSGYLTKSERRSSIEVQADSPGIAILNNDSVVLLGVGGSMSYLERGTFGFGAGTIDFYPICETTLKANDRHSSGWGCAETLDFTENHRFSRNGFVESLNRNEFGDDFIIALPERLNFKIKTFKSSIRPQISTADGSTITRSAYREIAQYEEELYSLDAGQYLLQLNPVNGGGSFSVSMEASNYNASSEYVTSFRDAYDGLVKDTIGDCQSPKRLDNFDYISGVGNYYKDVDCYILTGELTDSLSIENPDNSKMEVIVKYQKRTIHVDPGETSEIATTTGETGLTIMVISKSGGLANYTIPIKQSMTVPLIPDTAIMASNIATTTATTATMVAMVVDVGKDIYTSTQPRVSPSQDWSPDKLNLLDYFIYSRASDGFADTIKNPGTYTYWSHAGLFSGEDKYGSKSIIHAIGLGHTVVETPASYYLDKEYIKKLYWVSQPLFEETRDDGITYLRKTHLNQTPYALFAIPGKSHLFDVLSDPEKLGIYCSALVRTVYGQLEFNQGDGTVKFNASDFSSIQDDYTLFYTPLDLATNAVETGRVVHFYDNSNANTNLMKTLDEGTTWWGGYIENRNDEHWYQLSVQAGRTYTVSTSASTTSMDTVLYLYEYCGSCESRIFQLIALNNDKETGGEYSQLTFTTPASDDESPKTYYAMVRGNLDSIGGYRINVLVENE